MTTIAVQEPRPAQTTLGLLREVMAIATLSDPRTSAHCFLETPLRLWNGCGFSIHENLHGRNTVLDTHRHDLAYVSLTMSGSHVEHSGIRETRCPSGSASFHPPFEEHALVVGDRELRRLNIEIQPELINRLCEIHANDLEFLHDNGGPLVWLCARMYEEVTCWSTASPLIVEGLVLEILGHVSKTQSRGEDRAQPRWITMLDQIIRAEFQRSWTVAELAERVGVHRVHLSRGWRRFRGCSVGESVNRLRIEQACRRLAEGATSLVDVALDVGFGDQTHFSRVFKNLTGATPGAFRSTFARKGHNANETKEE